MKALSSTRERGPSGPAKVAIAGKKVTVTMLDTNGQETFQTFSFPIEELPFNVGSGKYFVSLSLDGTKFYTVRPLAGMFVCKAERCASAPTQGGGFSVPIPKHVQGERQSAKGSYTVDEQTFTVICKVTEGAYEGMEIPLPFLYFRKSQSGGGGSGFTDDGEGNVAVRGSGKRIEVLVSFLESTGIWDTQISYSENILPSLDVAFKSSKPFVVILNKGWPDAYSPAPEAPAKRKVAAKKTASKPPKVRKG